MDRARFQRLNEVLGAVWDAHPDERPGVLDRLCEGQPDLRQEVERLISFDRTDSFLEVLPRPPLVAPAAETEDLHPTTAAGTPSPTFLSTFSKGSRIGHYELLEPLGRGGMGAVFLGRRDDDVHRQQVAIKVLDSALATGGAIERFKAEREILAHLSHPNIARLLDGGTTRDGRPYLVMERVKGIPIDEYCRGLGLEERLRLFQKVCSAVHEAHRNLIVHRDLKPANILVDSDGEPKLLDFGIAKLLHPDALPRTLAETTQGPRPMTPAYASPEQLTGGAITIAVDVYALGILLYELLTGLRPYDLTDAPLLEIIRRICHQLPVKPSTRVRLTRSPEEGKPADPEKGPAPTGTTVEDLAGRGLPGIEIRGWGKRLRGDLDTITQVALRKEPERRYPSVESLRDDLERHLNGLPIKAADASLSYRLAKFVRRHRWPVIAATFVVLLLSTMTFLLLVQRQEVLAERDEATFTSEFLLDLFTGVDPWSLEARDPSAAEMLDRGRAALESSGPEAPDVRADLLHTMGRAYAGIGRYREAESLLRECITLRRGLSDGLHRGEMAELGESLVELSEVVRWQGEAEEGLGLVDEGREILEGLGLREDPRWIAASLRQADLLDQLGSYRRAEASYLAAHAVSQRVGRQDLGAVALQRLGLAHRRLFRYQEGVSALERALEEHRQSFGEGHPRVASVLVELGTLYLAMGDMRRAEELFTEAQGTFLQTLGETHPEMARLWSRRGQLELERGALEAASEHLNRAERVFRDRLGDIHPLLAEILEIRTALHLARGQAREAGLAIRESLAIRRQLFGNEHVETAGALHQLAMVEAQQGSIDDARAHISEALAILEKLLGEGNPRATIVLAESGWIELLGGRRDLAEPLLSEALARLQGFYSGRHGEIAKVQNNLAIVHHQLGKLEEAERGYRAAIEEAQGVYGEEAPLVAVLKTNLARLQVGQGQLAEGRDSLVEAKKILDSQGLPVAHRWRLHIDRILAKSWMAEGSHQKADAILRPWVGRVATDPSLGGFEKRSTLGLMASNLEALGRDREAQQVRAMLDSVDYSNR